MADASMFVPEASDWAANALDTIFNSDGVLAAGILIYNTAWMAIGAMLLLYIIVRVVVETARSGEMGGKHSEAWLPVRIVLAVGLLTPLPPNGLNAGQYIVLGVARMGIALGSAVWGQVVNVAAQMRPLVVPVPPEVREVARGVFLVEYCAAIQNITASTSDGPTITYNVDRGLLSTTYSADGDRSKGGIKAQCGTIMVRRPLDVSGNLNGSASQVLAAHITAVRELQAALRPAAEALARRMLPPFNGAAEPQIDVVAAMRRYVGAIQDVARTEVTRQNARTEEFRQAATNGGWVKAGAWGLNLLWINQTLMDAVYSLPSIDPPRYDWWQRDAYAAQRAALQAGDQWWSENHGAKTTSTEWAAYNATQNNSAVFNFWHLFDFARIKEAYDLLLLNEDSTNPMSKMVSLGHALVQIFWGAVLTYAGVSAAAAATADAANAVGNIPVVGGLASKFTGLAAALAGGGGKFLETLGPVVWLLLFGLLSAGVALAYILPLTPAMLWVFGVARYIMRVVMTALGAPVWAVAHLEIEGEGLGNRATQGYLVLLDLFARPMVMLMGLIVGLACFVVLGDLFVWTYRESVGNALTGHWGGITGLIIYSIVGVIIILTLTGIAMWGLNKGADYVMSLAGVNLYRDEEPDRDVAVVAGKTGAASHKGESAVTGGTIRGKTPPGKDDGYDRGGGQPGAGGRPRTPRIEDTIATADSGTRRG